MRALALLGVALLLAGAGAGGGRARVALLATPPAGTETALYLVDPDATALPAPAARFSHLPYASVQAAVVPGTSTVLAVVDRAPGRDRSFASSLVAIAPGAEPAWLVDGVVMASRPLVTGGRAIVARGRAGADPGDGSYRVDDLTVDEIDPAGGRAPRTLHAMRGYLLYVAGAWRDEIIIYRVRPGEADLIAVGPGGEVRTLVPRMVAFARDFSVDGDVVAFTNRHETDARRWLVEHVDLAGATRRAPTPAAAPGGTVDRTLAATAGAAAVLRVRPGALPEPFVVDRATGALRRLPAPPGARVTLAGFVP